MKEKQIDEERPQLTERRPQAQRAASAMPANNEAMVAELGLSHARAGPKRAAALV